MARLITRNAFKTSILYRLGEPVVTLIAQKRGTVETAVTCATGSCVPSATGMPGATGTPGTTGTPATGAPCKTTPPDTAEEMVISVMNQLDICVDDALDYFKLHSSDLGNEQDLLLVELQQGKMEYEMSPGIISINQPMKGGRAGVDGLGFQFDAEESQAAVGLFSWQSQFGSRGIYGNLGGGTFDNLLTTEVAMEYIALVESRYMLKWETNYNPLTRKLVVFPQPKANDHGKILAFIAIRGVGDDQCFNSLWLQRYATALLARQIGANMSKYTGFVLPGGGTYNPDYYINFANDEIPKLEDEIMMGKWGNVPSGGLFLQG